MKKILLSLASLCLATSIFAQKELLQSGPMLGHSDFKEVLLWVQTTAPADVKIAYWVQDSTNAPIHFTSTYSTKKEEAFTAKLIATEVEPGNTYTYQVYINEQLVKLDYPTSFQSQDLWQWRHDPPPFTVALGSCTFVNEPIYDRPGNGYGSDYQIFENIHALRPDLMLWLGDNIYFREVDYSWTGMCHRYTHTRSLAEMQPLLGSTHHYAIWDDHDFGPNNSDRTFVHKDKSQRAFELFWGNPTQGIPQVDGGITSQFQWNDMDFFLLDNRYFRSPNNCKTCEPTLLGKAQLDWLVESLAASRAPFKLVAIGGPVLNTAAVYENYAHNHQSERDYLLQRIADEGIQNVIFLSGDRHHTELDQQELMDGITIYDLTVSPLTSGSARSVTEENAHRVEGTVVTQRNFGMLKFSGPRTERQLQIRIMDSNGQELWIRTIESVRSN